MSQPGEPLSLRALAKALGLDRRGVARDCKRGMPRTHEGALAWRMTYVRSQKGTSRPSIAEAQARVRISPKVVAFDYANPPVEGSEEDLAASLDRLRRLEKTCAQSLERLLREGRIAEAQSLRRDHSQMIKAIFDASSRLLKLEEARGKLVSLDTALGMISESLSEPIILLRQLPSLGRDSGERAKLEAFMNGVLEAMKEGARRGLERLPPSSKEYSL